MKDAACGKVSKVGECEEVGMLCASLRARESEGSPLRRRRRVARFPPISARRPPPTPARTQNKKPSFLSFQNNSPAAMADNNDVASFFGFAGAASALVFSCESCGRERARARSCGTATTPLCNHSARFPLCPLSCRRPGRLARAGD